MGKLSEEYQKKGRLEKSMKMRKRIEEKNTFMYIMSVNCTIYKRKERRKKTSE